MQDSERDRLTVEVCEAVSAISPAGSHLATTAARLREMVGQEVPAGDYMKEVERLMRQYTTAVLEQNYEAIALYHFTLLAHIQRGAVPEGDDGKRVLREVFALCEDTEAKCYEDPSDFNRGRSFEAKGIARAIGAWYQEEFCGRSHMGEPAAPAPDHFRDAAEMVPEFSDSARAALLWVLWHHQGGSSHIGQPIRFALGMGQHEHLNDWQVAEAKRWGASCGLGPGDCRDPAPAPAEVPMPQGYVERPSDYTGDIWIESQMRTYGAACRAAGEAAGYAHAIKVIKRLRDSHQTATGECQSDCDFVTAWDSAIDALRGEVKP